MIRKTIIVVLTLATVGSLCLWVTSHGAVQEWKFSLGRTTLRVVAGAGYAMLGLYGSTQRPSSIPPIHKELLGGQIIVNWSVGLRSLCFPAWVPCTIFGAYPLFTLVMILARRLGRRQRRKEHGLCVDCGYDLTGNVTGVCSECGLRIGAE